MDTVLVVSDINKFYDKKKAVDNISFNINRGDVVGLLGKNGAGKTTIMKIIMKLISRNSGSIRINGLDIDKEGSKALLDIGCTIETPKHFEYLTGYDNLLLTANLLNNVGKKEILDTLDTVGLSNQANKKVKTYSLGMKQRLSIARALLGNPKIVILDEPVNGLDPQGMKDVYNIIKKYSTEYKVSFLISSHLLHDLQEVCNKIIVIDNGKKILEGVTSEILNQTKETVQIFTNDITKLKKLISINTKLKLLNSNLNFVKVELLDITFFELNQWIIRNNIEITNILKDNNSLEDLFLSLTKESV